MKTCTKCHLLKDDHNFALKRNKLNVVCKSCKNEYNKVWYSKNKEKHKSATKANNSKYASERLELINSLKNFPCKDCGNKFPPCAMDFDHLDSSQKDFGISRMVRGHESFDLERLMKEIAKCELVCANCHRVRTQNRHHAPTVGQSLAF